MSLTIPNLLSLLRMGIVPLFIISVIHGQVWQPLVLFVAAGITDALDGFIARFFDQQSRLGAYLDPAADKLLLVSAYASLAVPSLSAEGLTIPVWITILVISRDVFIVIVALILYLTIGVNRFPPAMISKVTTALQIIAVVVVLVARILTTMEPLVKPILIAVAVLTVASALNYLYLANRMVSEKGETEG